MTRRIAEYVEVLEMRRLLASYYVSPAGSDAAAGTSTLPWATLQKAADTVGAGDTVTVRAGTYASGFVLGWDAPTAGTSAAPITFQADPAGAVGSVIITGRNSKTADGVDLESGCDYIVIRGLKINNAGGTITRAGIRVSGSRGVQVLDNVV